MNPSSRLHPDHMSYPGQGQADQTGQGRVRRMDSTSGTSHSSHHSSANSHHNSANAKRYQEYQSSNGHANLAPQPPSGQVYRSNQYQMSPRSSRSDLRERDRDPGSYSPASHPSSPSLPYPPGSGPSTPNRPYSSQGHPFQYAQHAIQPTQPGDIVTPAQSQSQARPPYPYLNQPPVSPHSAGPNLSPGLSAAMNDLRMPQRSATDPQQWENPRNRYEDGGRSRSRTMYPEAGEDTYGAYGPGRAPASAQGRAGEGLGLGPVGGQAQYRDRSPNRSYGVPGPGPSTERQTHNPNNLRIAPPSPSRQGRRSPHRSPTTPNSGNMPSYMNVPLPSGSDQSHQSQSHINVTSPNGHVEAVQPGHPTRNPRNLSPTADGTQQGDTSRPYDVHTHGTFASTAPGPPVTRGSGIPASNSQSTGTVTSSSTGTLTTSNTTTTYSSTSSASLDAKKIEAGNAGGADSKDNTPAGNQGSRAGGSGGGVLPPGSICGSCTKPVKRQFVRAMGKVYHLDCFRCKVSRIRKAISDD